MSCFVVSNNHVNTICSYASHHALDFVQYEFAPHQQGNWQVALGQCLLDENVRQYNMRYGEEFKPEPYAFVPNLPCSGAQFLKALLCLDYQCNESEDYQTTLASKLINSLMKACVMRMPELAECEWGIQ